MLLVVIQVFLYQAASAQVHQNINVAENEFMWISDFAEKIAENYLNQNCTRVTFSDTRTVPPIAKNQVIAVQNFFVPENEIVVNSTLRGKFKIDKWPYFDVQSVGNCVLYTVVSRNDFERSLDEGSMLFKLDNYHHYFIIHCVGEDCNYQEGALYSEKLDGLKYKIFISKMDEDKYKLSSVSFFGDNGFTKTVQIGEVDCSGIKLFYPNPFPDFTLDLNWNPVKAVYFEDINPEKIRQLRANKEIVDLVYLIVELIAEKLHVNLVGERSDVPPIDLIMEDGSWTGFVGEILSRKYNGSVVTVALSTHLRHASLTSINTFEVIAYAARKPNTQFSWKALYQPLAPDAWLGIFLSCIGCALFLAIVLYVNGKTEMLTIDGNITSYSFLAIFLSIIGIGVDYPHSHSGRVFIALWLFVSIIFSATYQCKLLSMITFPQMETIPSSFSELAASKFKVGCFADHCTYFDYLSEPDTRPFIREMITTLQYLKNTRECVEKVSNEDFACLSVRTMLQYETFQFLDMHGKEVTDIHSSGGTEIFVASLFRRDFVPTDTLSKLFSNIIESGIRDYLERQSAMEAYFKGTRDSTRFSRGTSDESKPLKMIQFTGHFGILILGLILGLLAFLFEMLFGKLKCCHSK